RRPPAVRSIRLPEDVPDRPASVAAATLAPALGESLCLASFSQGLRPTGSGWVAAGADGSAVAAAAGAGASGKVIVKAAPEPSCELRVAVPPWASARASTIARPRPEPTARACAPSAR